MHSESIALGLIGFPLGHSYSAAIHCAALAELHLPGDYKLFPVQPLPEGSARLQVLLTEMREGRLSGLNVTIPWKKAIFPYLDNATDMAGQVGAVNTIFLDGGHLVGDNTDASGFFADLSAKFPDIPADGTALILGAGGSAYAVAHALLQHERMVHVAARRIEQAEALVQHFRATFGPKIPAGAVTMNTHSLRDLVASREVSLLVNCTPVGMAPNSQYSPWPDKVPFPKQAKVYDLVYNPTETVLVRQARRQALQAVTGGGMLVEQAALAFERWFGIPAPRLAMGRAFQIEASKKMHSMQEQP